MLCAALPLWVWAGFVAVVHGDNLPPLRFASIFLAGVLLYLYKDVVPDSAVIAGAGLALAAAGLAVSADAVIGLGIAYPTIWIAAHLPLRLGSVHDLSYGMYIYGWPVQQVLLMGGAAVLAYWITLPIVFLATLPVAAASWFLIEKPAMRFKSRAVTRSRQTPQSARTARSQRHPSPDW